MELVSEMDNVHSLTGAVSKCAAGMICHVHMVMEIAWRTFAARAQMPCGLTWMPSLLKNDAHSQKILKWIHYKGYTLFLLQTLHTNRFLSIFSFNSSIPCLLLCYVIQCLCYVSFGIPHNPPFFPAGRNQALKSDTIFLSLERTSPSSPQLLILYSWLYYFFANPVVLSGVRNLTACCMVPNFFVANMLIYLFLCKKNHKISSQPGQ